jgi:hypothetical protein
VQTPPSITTQPVDTTVIAGQIANFTVTATGTKLSYQWTKNGVNITGATLPSYTTPPTTLTDDGSLFAATVTNSVGSVTSNNATLTVIPPPPPPSITTQPVDQTVTVSQAASFTVTATGTNLFYQWTKNGVNITGATNPSYTTPPTTLADNGSLFAVTVTNIVGSVTSNNATLTVNPLPARSADIIKTYGRLVIPSTGIYWGAEDQDSNFTGVGGIETVLGRTMAIRRNSYFFVHPVLPTAFERNNANHINPHIIVAINQQYDGSPSRPAPVKFTAASKGGPPNFTWSSRDTAPNAHGKTGIDRITDGEFDAAFIADFNGLKALPGPVIYMLWKEFNGYEHNQCAEAQGVHGTALWSPGSGEIAFRDAYRHIRGLADTCGASINHGGNIIFVWATQGATTNGWFENYYPGDDYVDFIGHDLYRGTVSHDLDTAVPTTGTGDNLIYKFAQGLHTGSAAVGRVEGVVKPMIICEAGFDNGVDYPDDGFGGDTRNYQKDIDLSPPAPLNMETKTLDDLQYRYPNVVAYVHWNETGDTVPTHYNKVDQSAASLDRYKTFVNDPYCGLFYIP